MTDRDTAGDPADAALEALLALARERGIAPMADAPDAFDRLSEDERRVLTLLLVRSDQRIAAEGSLDAEPDIDDMTTAADSPDVQADAAEGGSDPGPAVAENPAESIASPKPTNPEDGDAAAPSEDTPLDSAPEDPPSGAPKPERAVSVAPSNIPKVPGLSRKSAAAQDVDWISLPNGRRREPYSAPVPGFDALRLRDGDGSGLTLDDEGCVTGRPDTAGEYTLTFSANRDGRALTLKARVSIIHDPRDLWTSTPSDRSDPFWKPDEAFAQTLGDAMIAAASKRGRSHAKEGRFRDDDFAIHAEGPGGWHVMIVADGAGSASHSREGSRVVCQTVLEALPGLIETHIGDQPAKLIPAYLANPEKVTPQIRRELLYPVLGAAALAAAKALSAAAEAHGIARSALSTTLILAITRRFGDHWFTATYSMGDGGAAIYDDDTGEVQVLCKPDSGEFAGQTRFLDEAAFARAQPVLDRIFLDIRRDFTLLALMTDGITDPKFVTDRTFASTDAWQHFWREDFGPSVRVGPDNPALELELFEWLDFWSKGNHDDRTLAILVPPPSAPEAG